IPPLDGSKVIFPFLPRFLDGFVAFMNQYGPMILLGLILVSFLTNLPIFGILLAPIRPLLTLLGLPVVF
ncbi:MAG: site-2 protease family protein, partial [Rubrobacteraceae bacterium]|nr:site-2 protease family protein [Rubrobacteraceae bacterium]